MNMARWLSALPRFLALLPLMASCYYTMKNQTRHSLLQTAALCTAVLLPYSILGSYLCAVLRIDANAILLPSLVLFFFLYRRTVTASLPKCLAVYVGVCAVQSFPAQFAYSLDAFLHPASGAADISVEAAFFQLGLTCLIAAAFAWPACQFFFQVVDRLGSPRIWYSTVALSSVFLLFNVLGVPKSYSTLHTGRIFYLFLLLEGCLLAVLTAIYLLFYWGTSVVLEHAELKERTQLLEIQSRQYRALQEHMRQTAQLRHDFRHSIRLLSDMAGHGDLEGIRTYLAQYEQILTEKVPVNYCANGTLNALFRYYHEMAVSAGIDTAWKIELPNPLTVSELDLASLFGNILENGIEGCQTLPEGERYFNLSTELRHGNSLYIVSTNSFDGHVKKEQTGYRSTKRSGTGIGLSAIAAVAEKYDGVLQVSNSDREFFTDVVIKI